MADLAATEEAVVIEEIEEVAATGEVVEDLAAIEEAVAAVDREAAVVVAREVVAEVEGINIITVIDGTTFQIVIKCYSQRERNTGKHRKGAFAALPNAALPLLLDHLV